MEVSDTETVEKSSEMWVRERYVLERKAYVAEQQSNFLRDNENSAISRTKNPKDISDAIKIGKEVEEKYLPRADFEEVRKIDPDYLRLVEDFASKLTTNKPFVELSFIEYSSLVEAFAGRARELRKKASEIAEEHNTQEDKASYALFRLRAFIFKTGPGWSYSAPETKEVEKLMPKGIAQLRKDLRGLDKERGTYELSLEGTSFVKKEMSRLEALTQRTFLNVKPISPTKPFLTKQQEVKVYA